ncbi:MAG: carboxypeptidase regulatory-like domain-containing protein [Terracidiphilus sp.]
MTTVRFAKRVSLLVVLSLGLGGLAALAQFLSGIEGTVHDSSGAVIAGAKVTITDTRLGVTRTTTTNEAGYFRFDSIAASGYTLEIQMTGFKTFHQSGLTLEVGQLRTLAPVLEVGDVSTNVTVSAVAATVDLATPTTGTVISNVTLDQTPLPGQNIYGLSALTPGMTGAAVETAGNDNYTNEYAVNINAAGLRQEQNGYEIDGAYTNTPSRGGGTSISPNPEIVQSEDVRTNDFDAQKGRNGGATVDVFTKSGSNQFHGNIDYWFTNENLSALTHFESSLPPYQRNEFSFTMGGPVFRNKLFWFGAIDVLRSSVTTASTSTVETQDLYNWVNTNLPNTVADEIMTLAPPSTYATASSPGAETVSQITGSYYPAPSGIPPNLDALGNVNFTFSAPKNGYQWSFRIDDYLGQNDRIYVDAIRTYDTTGVPQPRPALSNVDEGSSDFVNVDWTHTFSSHLLNEAGANIIRPYGQNGGAPAFQIPYINVTGLSGFSNWGPGNFTQTTVGWRDVMTASIKTHTLKFGFDQFNIRENDTQGGAFDRPTYNFNSLLDFIQGKATSESGTPVSLITHQEAPYNRRYRELYTGFFVQDDWKIKPTFTLNAGVRYDSMGNLFSILSPQFSNFNFGTGTGPEAQVAAGVAALNPNNHVVDHNVWGLTPRVGFSWDIFGNGKTALRGGIGMFSDQPPYLHITDITAGNLPNFYTPSVNVQQGTTPALQLCDPPNGFNDTCPVVDTSNVTLNSSGGVVADGVLQRASLGGSSPNYKMTQVYDWTLSIQRQLPHSLIAQLNYSASAAHHLPVYSPDVNRFTGDLVMNKGTLTRLNPNFGTIQYATSDSNSIGNYGSAMLTRTMAHGLALQGIYTYGKTLDIVSSSGSLDGGAITSNANGGNSSPIFQNFDYPAQRGRADFDIHQQFSANGTWMVPNNYPNALERNVLGGWQFAGVWILQTGLPFTVYTSAAFDPVYDSNGNVIGNTGGDYNADGYNWDLPNVPSFGNHLSGKHKSDFLNGLFTASAFPVPTLGTEGSLGRNTYDQLGYNRLDFTFEKLFKTPWFFGERMTIEAKGEVFNFLNRSNLTGMSSDLSSGTFGHMTNQLPARYLQVHLRASF